MQLDEMHPALPTSNLHTLAYQWQVPDAMAAFSSPPTPSSQLTSLNSYCLFILVQSIAPLGAGARSFPGDAARPRPTLI